MSAEFQAILQRFMEMVGARTQKELAKGIRLGESAISSAKHAQKIPDTWFSKARELYNYRRTWLETGEGPREYTAGRSVEGLPVPYRQLLAVAEGLAREDFEVLLCLANLQRNGDAKMRQHLRSVSEFAARAQARESSNDSFDGNTPSELACNS